MVSFTCQAKCPGCIKRFKTLYALRKHVILKHVDIDADAVTPVFQDEDGLEVSVPKCQAMNPSDLEHYKLWLAGLAERFNSQFHPRMTGWYKVVVLFVLVCRYIFSCSVVGIIFFAMHD